MYRRLKHHSQNVETLCCSKWCNAQRQRCSYMYQKHSYM